MNYLQNIYNKVNNNINLTKEDAITLLNIPNKSKEYYELINQASNLSKQKFGNKGYVFVQIGLNCAPCSGNCKFCSLACDNYLIDQLGNKSSSQILEQVQIAVNNNVSAVFLMTTADYDFGDYINIAKQARAIMPKQMMLIANIGDFGIEQARILKETGFYGAYHIVRLNEGIDTDLDVELRINTLNAIKEAGLELLYCIEPIGPEHTYDQIAQEMIRARDYNVNIMACMKRVAIQGSPMYDLGEINDEELTKIVAVTGLVANPKMSMNVHEPNIMAMSAGVNQLYAEAGVNPRDKHSETQDNRGKSIEEVRAILKDNGYTNN